jgi:hypothetical protein
MAINTIPRSYQAWPNTYANAAVAPVNATPADFNLDAGLYGLTVSAGVWGNATLQKLLPDGTYANVGAFAANGYSTLELPAGQYRMLLAGVAAFDGVIELISRGIKR